MYLTPLTSIAKALEPGRAFARAPEPGRALAALSFDYGLGTFHSPPLLELKNQGELQ
jgi:hypothetical protein